MQGYEMLNAKQLKSLLYDKDVEVANLKAEIHKLKVEREMVEAENSELRDEVIVLKRNLDDRQK